MKLSSYRTVIPRGIILLLIVSMSMLSLYGDEQLLNRAMRVETAAQLEELRSMVSTDPGEEDLCLGIALHNVSAARTEYIDEAMEHLELAWNRLNDPLALAYLGSAQTIRAGRENQAGNVIEAVRDIDAGISKIDEAVGMDPDNITLRFLRIFNGIDLTYASPVSREEVIARDIEYLKEQITGEGSPAGKETRAGYWYALGELRLLQGHFDEALSSLEQAIAAAPESSYAASAEDLLWELEE